jgi:hypothetical protein
MAPRLQVGMVMKRHRFSSAIFGVFLLLLASLSACNLNEDQTDAQPEETCASIASDKLMQGLADLVDTFYCEGEQSAIVFAKRNGITLEQGRVPVHIYTRGDRSEAFVADLDELGIEEFNASSLHNIAWANLPIERLQELAEQDFVIYIVPEPTTVIEP